MKREILFRGQDKYSGEWVYGSICTDNKDVFEIWSPEIQESGKLKFKRHEVRSVSIGQYWRTVNDQKLFDGDVFDVIVATEGESTYSVRFIAKYQNDEECFQITNLADLHSTLWNFTKRPFAPNADWWTDEKKEIKVIGNIHENPELLKSE